MTAGPDDPVSKTQSFLDEIDAGGARPPLADAADLGADRHHSGPPDPYPHPGSDYGDAADRGCDAGPGDDAGPDWWDDSEPDPGDDAGPGGDAGPDPDRGDEPGAGGVEPPAGGQPGGDRRAGARFSRPAVAGFVGATAAVMVAVAAAMIAMRPSHRVIADPAPDAAPTIAVIAPPAPATPAPGPAADGPIPYTASADCPPGSTTAQAVDGSRPTQAWVCVRDGADGQVLTLDLGRPMVISAVSIVPGWVGADASGVDQWMAHRVVKRVGWILANGDQKLPVTQDTGGVRGPAVKQIPGSGPDRGVLASRIQMIVQETARPAAQGAAPPDPAGGGPLTDILGAPLGGAPAPALPESDPTGGDPVDNTFAVSAITVLGHPPQ